MQEPMAKKPSAVYYVIAVLLVAGIVGFGITGIAELSALNILAAVACGVGLIAVAYAVTKGGRASPVVRRDRI